MIKSINIKGYRGFGESEDKINFAVPNGKKGSGITYLLGQNNTGKSTILESLKFFASNDKSINLNFAENKRNRYNNNKVEIILEVNNGKKYSVKSDENMKFLTKKVQYDPLIIYNIPSKRTFPHSFTVNRTMYTLWHVRETTAVQPNRSYNYNNSIYFINEVSEKKKDFFNFEIKKVLDFPEWRIDMNNDNSLFIEFYDEENTHNSEGVGEGILSIMSLIGTLIFSEKDSVVLIDEPESSLHPEVISRLSSLLLEYSKDRQIIISTHSPYMVDIQSILNGAKVIRTTKKNGLIKTHELNDESIEFINSLSKYATFPHAVGLDAKEIFFQSEKIIVVEGQEDVVGFRKNLSDTDKNLLKFYGWGAGGAGNIIKVVKLLQNLGFEKIVAIYDGDQKKAYEKIKKEVKGIKAIILSTDDIRDKDDKEGMLDKDLNLKDNYETEFNEIVKDIKKVFGYNKK